MSKANKNTRKIFPEKNHYNYESSKYLEKLNQKNYFWYEDVLKEVIKCQPKNVLELGCGNGDFSLLCAKYNVRNIMAVDNSSLFLKNAQAKNKNVTFKKMDLEDEKVVDLLLNRGFDCIVAIDVLEHLSYRNILLKKISKLKNIHFILQCPNLYCNLIGTNYEFKVYYILIKLFRGIKGYYIY